MSGLRTFLSVPVVLLATFGLAGCYDLSTDGPHRDDFIRDRSTNQTQTQTQEQQGQQARAIATSATAPDAENPLLDALEESDDYDLAVIASLDKIRITTDD